MECQISFGALIVGGAGKQYVSAKMIPPPDKLMWRL